ncbi:MAG: adenine phosphoribosyltransferase [Acidobacteriota bacterium]|nr:adenine phosphoribosyltransferase [Acidobacteriota bacterium]MDH3785850.1 adenine phosphoribosyltransferase [Acidobacteriota bacterium]
MLLTDLKKSIRRVDDFPKPGIRFYDLSTLFRDGKAFGVAIDKMVERYRDQPIDAIAGIEARGFVIAAALAHKLELGIIMVRKVGKLPHVTERETYSLEYGEAEIEIHRDAVEPGERVIIVDDVLATGGTASAAGRLVKTLGGRVDGYAFLAELDFLSGRGRLEPEPVFSLLRYDS